MRKQLAFILARQGQYASLQNLGSTSDESEQLSTIITNSRLAEFYNSLATDLGITAPKDPEDIFKSGPDSSKPPFTSKII